MTIGRIGDPSSDCFEVLFVLYFPFKNARALNSGWRFKKIVNAQALRRPQWPAGRGSAPVGLEHGHVVRL